MTSATVRRARPEDWARADGFTRLTLWVADQNQRALAFYLRMGFRLTGARQRYRREDGTELAEQEMALDLASPAAGR